MHSNRMFLCMLNAWVWFITRNKNWFFFSLKKSTPSCWCLKAAGNWFSRSLTITPRWIMVQFSWPSMWAYVSVVWAVEPASHSKSAFMPIAVNGGPVWVHWHGPYRAILSECTRISLCICSSRLCGILCGYPEAVLLRTISAKSAAQALFRSSPTLASWKIYWLTGELYSCPTHWKSYTNYWALICSDQHLPPWDWWIGGAAE